MSDRIDNKRVKNYYDEVADDYNQNFYEKEDKYPTLKYRHNYMLDMVDALEWAEGATALDIGCGPGEMVMDLADRGFTVTGIDISPEMIRIADEKTQKRSQHSDRITYEVGDIEQLKYPDNSFDLVICSGVVEYLQGDARWSKELKRVLKPGGVLVINVTNKFAVRRWTQPLIEGMKRFKPFYHSANFVKEKVLRRGKLNYFPFRPRVHSPKKFDQFLADQGYEKISHNYFDFSLAPAPMDTMLSFVSIPIRKNMEKKHSHKNMAWSGTGYIVSARLTK